MRNRSLSHPVQGNGSTGLARRSPHFTPQENFTGDAEQQVEPSDGLLPLSMLLRGSDFHNISPEDFQTLATYKVSEKDDSLDNDTAQEPIERKCIICMANESTKRPFINLPCKNQCKRNLVHKNCIFEWKEQHEGKGSCPLCRGRLGKINYTPPDFLNSKILAQSFANRKLFNLSPVPKKAGMVRCYLKVKNNPWWGSPYLYEFYLQKVGVKKYPHGPLPDSRSPYDGDILLMTAKKRAAQMNLNGVINHLGLNVNFHSIIDVSMEKDFDRQSKNYLGDVSASSFTGLEYTVNALVYDADLVDRSYLNDDSINSNSSSGPKCGIFNKRRSRENLSCESPVAAEVGCIHYSQNRIGAESGPRKMKVCIPNVKTIPRDKCAKTIFGKGEVPAPLGQKQEDLDNGNKMSPSAVAASKSAKVEARNSIDINASNSMALLDQEDKESAATDEKASTANPLCGIEDFSSDEEDSDDENASNNVRNDFRESTGFYRPKTSRESLNKRMRKHRNSSGSEATANSPEEEFLFGHNKKPCWLQRIQAYSLDFNGRVTLPSNKNFQIELEQPNSLPGPRDDGIVLQFGKVISADECVENVSVYTVDFRYPMSPIQALGICLSSCDRKFGCA